MNPIRYRTLIAAATLALSCAGIRSEEQPAEAIELIRLRQQFQHRVEQEMAPWHEKYRKELLKLENRLIAERKLVEALAVKKEREASAPLSHETAASGGFSKIPSSVDEARETLAGSVWLVYQKEDRKRKTPLDVYHFLDGDTAFVFSQKRLFKWSLQSAAELSVEFLEGKIEVKFDFEKSEAASHYLTTEYVMVLAGNTTTSRK